MVWLVYPLTTIVPNYSAFRKRNRRLFNRELLRQARRQLATSSILVIVWPHVNATQSTDSGATWSPNVRMTSAQSNFDGNDLVLGIIRHLLRSTARCGRSFQTIATLTLRLPPAAGLMCTL
jgi:hypothetical protein